MSEKEKARLLQMMAKAIPTDYRLVSLTPTTVVMATLSHPVRYIKLTISDINV